MNGCPSWVLHQCEVAGEALRCLPIPNSMPPTNPNPNNALGAEISPWSDTDQRDIDINRTVPPPVSWPPKLDSLSPLA